MVNLKKVAELVFSGCLLQFSDHNWKCLSILDFGHSCFSGSKLLNLLTVGVFLSKQDGSQMTIYCRSPGLHVFRLLWLLLPSCESLFCVYQTSSSLSFCLDLSVSFIQYSCGQLDWASKLICGSWLWYVWTPVVGIVSWGEGMVPWVKIILSRRCL